MASLKVTVNVPVPNDKSVAANTGSPLTVGAAVSGAAAVVNVFAGEGVVKAFPAASCSQTRV
jgi:hypothetical protein